MQLFPNTIAASPFAAPKPSDSGSGTGSTSSSSDTSSTTVTANDFLQLLVTEMRNQDPTADTDPNEYINQLVQVNSLEQLVQINQDLTPTSSSSGSSGSSPNVAPPAAAEASRTAPAVASGNLSAADTGSTAARIAAALGSQSPGASSSPLNNIVQSLRARAQQPRAAQTNPAQ
jgi:flagellar basal-body rod modification protein FlgD